MGGGGGVGGGCVLIRLTPFEGWGLIRAYQRLFQIICQLSIYEMKQGF